MPKADQYCCPNAQSSSSELADERLVAAFKALGDNNRLAMFRMIVEAGDDTLCSCEIEPRLSLSQPTISHHLKLLRKAGLISGEKSGTWVHYRAVPQMVKLLQNALLPDRK